MTRIALDTNILAYLAGVIRTDSDAAKVDRIRDLIARLAPAAELVAPVQTLGELFVVLRRGGAAAEEARAVLLEFAEAFATPPSEAAIALTAADLVVDHKLQYWDTLILTAAADARCALLLSEDMQDGFVTRGLTVLNPLAEPMPAKLATILPG